MAVTADAIMNKDCILKARKTLVVVGLSTASLQRVHMHQIAAPVAVRSATMTWRGRGLLYAIAPWAKWLINLRPRRARAPTRQWWPLCTCLVPCESPTVNFELRACTLSGTWTQRSHEMAIHVALLQVGQIAPRPRGARHEHGAPCAGDTARRPTRAFHVSGVSPLGVLLRLRRLICLRTARRGAAMRSG